MGDFYQVIKTIKGHRYIYRQRTFRMGGQVKTESHYVGPAGAGDVARITAEREVRRSIPNLGQVTAAVKLLSDPSKAAAHGIKPWGAKGAVNTTFQRIETIDRHVASLGVRVVEHQNAEGAFFTATHDAVVMPSGERFISTEAFYFTLMHELAHWSGGQERLRRTIIGYRQINSREDAETYAREELVAEATAMIIMIKLGMPPKDKSQAARYFQGYLSVIGNKAEALEYVINEAHRAAGHILASSQLIDIKVQYGLV